MKRRFDIASVLIIIVGLAIVLYPTISNVLVSLNASRVVDTYTQAVDELTADEAAALMDEARAYNARLAAGAAPDEDAYGRILDVAGDGVMGYITIPRLDETMPIYHTCAESVLQVGCGHIEATSIPVGGSSTHAAISGHRGLPTAKLFTDLDEMKPGDVFYIRVLRDTLAYEVDDIQTVLPDEVDALRVISGEDRVTLVTCTPYGVNSHRLLVGAHRVSYAGEADDIIGRPGSPINLAPEHMVIVAAVASLGFIIGVARSKRKGERP